MRNMTTVTIAMYGEPYVADYNKMLWAQKPYIAACSAVRQTQCCMLLTTSHGCRFNAEDNASPLYLTEAAENSKFFKSLGKKVKKSLQEKPFAMENHANGQSLLCIALPWSMMQVTMHTCSSSCTPNFMYGVLGSSLLNSESYSV